MNTKELMVGDWMSIVDDFNLLKGSFQVTGVSHNRSIYYYDPQSEECKEFCDEDYCKPIRITNDILTNNGFKNTPRGWNVVCNNHIFILHKKFMWLFIEVNGRRIDIDYVHELQHALRLCGMNDFADNLKV